MFDLTHGLAKSLSLCCMLVSYRQFQCFILMGALEVEDNIFYFILFFLSCSIDHVKHGEEAPFACDFLFFILLAQIEKKSIARGNPKYNQLKRVLSVISRLSTHSEVEPLVCT